MRGLKSKNGHTNYYYIFGVAPHAGAWIEINIDPKHFNLIKVAPHAGAWIEICSRVKDCHYRMGRTSRRCVD